MRSISTTYYLIIIVFITEKKNKYVYIYIYIGKENYSASNNFKSRQTTTTPTKIPRNLFAYCLIYHRMRAFIRYFFNLYLIQHMRVS